MSVQKWARKNTGKRFAREIAAQHGEDHPALQAALQLARTGRERDMEAMLETFREHFTDPEMDALSDRIEPIAERTRSLAERIHAENEVALRNLRGERVN